MLSLDKEFLSPLLRHRENDSHKGNYGHLLLVCGCETMPGAAVLATDAALHSGCGLVTLHSTRNAAVAAVTACPSAMLSIDPQECFSCIPCNLQKYTAIAVGPGLGRDPRTVAALTDLMTQASSLGIPMVLDADALNIISENPALMTMVPRGSVMTPHLGELRRLGGDAVQLSRASGCVVVQKGYGSRIFVPADGQGSMDIEQDGVKAYANTTGNPGMAKGGSGDVLTGLVGGLLARGYSADIAAMLGVWIHGYAGDVLSAECTQESYSSADLVGKLCCGFKVLYGE